LSRLLLSGIFLVRHGPFSSHLIEIWYYLGVARGVERLSPFDPTVWILRGAGFLTAGEILYHLVMLSAIFLSSLTAALICLWVGKSFGRESGFLSGLCWAFLPAPLTLCLANFSHDLTQGPLLAGAFFCLAAASARGRPAAAWTTAAAGLLGLGLVVGPLAAGALLALALQGILLIGLRVFRRAGKAGFWFSLLAVAGLTVFLGQLFHRHWLSWLGPLAERFRGIDLASQVRIGVGDLLNFPPHGAWNRYGLFLLLVPGGLAAALGRRRTFPAILFLVAFVLTLGVNRSARLLDIAVAVCAGIALAEESRAASRVALGFAVLLAGLNLAWPAGAAEILLAVPFPERLRAWPGGSPAELAVWWQFWLAVPWALALNLTGRRVRLALLAVPAVCSALWLTSAASTASDQVEYELYRDLAPRALPGARIFAAWNQGYMIRALTALEPLVTPESIDYELTRVYWMSEEDAWRELSRRGARYVHISTRYFGLTWADPVTDRFAIYGSTIIGPRPDHIQRLSEMKKTLLYRLNYEPGELRRFRVLAESYDRERRAGGRIFELAREEPAKPVDAPPGP